MVLDETAYLPLFPKESQGMARVTYECSAGTPGGLSRPIAATFAPNEHESDDEVRALANHDSKQLVENNNRPSQEIDRAQGCVHRAKDRRKANACAPCKSGSIARPN